VRFETCGIGVVMIHGQLFTVSATGVVILKHGKLQETTASLGGPRFRLRGTQLTFRDAGYPAPQGR
jgi:hypothetical protein